MGLGVAGISGFLGLQGSIGIRLGTLPAPEKGHIKCAAKHYNDNIWGRCTGFRDFRYLGFVVLPFRV